MEARKGRMLRFSTNWLAVPKTWPTSHRVSVLLNSGFVLIAFAASLSLSAGAVPSLTLALAALFAAFCRRLTRSLLACFIFFVGYALLGMFPYLQHEVVSTVGCLVCFGESLPYVCPSAFVPSATLLVGVASLLVSWRLGVSFVAINIVAILSLSVSLSAWGSAKQVDASTLGSVIVLAQFTFLFVSSVVLMALLISEYGADTRITLPKWWIGAAVASFFLGLYAYQAVTERWNAHGYDERKIVFWWPDQAEDFDDFADVKSGVGLDHIGLFGQLPRLLKHAGFHVAQRDRIDAPALSEAGVLCLLTPFRSLETSERRQIHKFVSDGGSLLLAAEHTNMDGVRDIYNELLVPYGISINFDTATSLLDNSIKGTRTSNHPLGHIFGRHPELQYNRGASLSVHRLRSDPVLVGELWYTDSGDAMNEPGGYLGDQVWSSGDQAGETILVAAHRTGKGSVVVFGDTSPFINRNIAYNADFIRDLFGYLNDGIPDWTRRNTPQGSSAAHTFISTEESNVFSRDGFSPYSVTALSVVAMRQD